MAVTLPMVRAQRRARVTEETASPMHAGTTRADEPRWSRIAADIASAIEAGTHGEGETLPAAVTIAEHYGVNRHTVRQALKHLQARVRPLPRDGGSGPWRGDVQRE